MKPIPEIYKAAQNQSEVTRGALLKLPKMLDRLGQAAPRNLYDDDPEAVSEPHTHAPGGAIATALANYDCSGLGCGFQPCICMQQAHEPEMFALQAQIHILHEAVRLQADKIVALTADRDRYVDWNSTLGAENEALRDENKDMTRRISRQKEALLCLLDEVAGQAPAAPPPGAHSIFWPKHLPVPLFSGNAGAEQLVTPRLSASWEHLPDPCVPPVAAASAPPGSLAWALRQSHVKPLTGRR